MLEAFVGLAWYRGPCWFRDVFGVSTQRALQRTRATFARRMDRAVANRTDSHEIAEAMDHVLAALMYPKVLSDYARGTNPLRAIHPRMLVLEAPGPTGFVLGDNPARVWKPEQLAQLSSAPLPGLLDPGAAITYPLSPRVCLVLYFEPRGQAVRRATACEAMVRAVNTAQLTFAVDHVVLPGTERRLFLEGVELDGAPPWRESDPGDHVQVPLDLIVS